MKYYAVKKGRETGIFTTWDATERQVKGYSGAKFKSFKTREEAADYLSGEVANVEKVFIPSTKQIRARQKPAEKNADEKKHREIIVYTDGGSRNHGNVRGGHVKASDKAAWAFLIKDGKQKYSKSGGEFGATNNRMEIMAFLEALKYLRSKDMQNRQIDVVMDSKYVLDAIQKGWLAGWRRRGWTKSDGSKLQNKQLWQRVDANLKDFPKIQYFWTKGHAEDKGNVFVDHLLNKKMDKMSSQSIENPRPANKPANVPRHTEESRQPGLKPQTDTSVRDIENSLKQLGLFDDDDD